ncbi:orf40 [Sucra jujuba nucleopolyhedrovirus]|uniref:Orf40 n=1 Tax=Sucra jujuba nucleopolyhedrovirus TaxID=1563660 RepID=A0A097P903_9ABAC|nr:orf40 [Sucra jujuba nucleopolyhedrovirus]AIU41279.1 orf40 [Sucra jujuba nucleopolyhedrovirus]
MSNTGSFMAQKADTRDALYEKKIIILSYDEYVKLERNDNTENVFFKSQSLMSNKLLSAHTTFNTAKLSDLKGYTILVY